MQAALATTLTLLLSAGAAFAHSEPPVYDRIGLNESAQTDVDNDVLVGVLFAQAEGPEATAPADEVNRLMDWAVNVVGSHPQVKVQTLNYHTSALYQKGKIRGWRVNQSLRVESRDGRLLGDLIARLQERLKVQSIDYRVSEEQRRRHLDDLTAEALTRFRDRARHVAKTLGRQGFRIVRIDINDGRQQPVPMARGMMLEAGADASVAPARIEAGTQQLSVSVSGEIELRGD